MRVRIETLRIPYRFGRFAISGQQSQRATTLLVRVSDAEHPDLVGLGEATPSHRVTGTDSSAILMRLNAAERPLAHTHIDPDAPPPALPKEAGTNGPTACALDGALLDLWAQLRGEPIWQALGIPRHRKPTTATLSLLSADEMAAQAATLLDAGFSCLKLKLGEDSASDAQRLHAVRAAAPRATLRVDGNEGWRLKDALSLVPALAAAGVDILEQPLARSAPAEEHHVLNAALEEHDIAHVLDEAVHTAADVTRIGTHRLAHGVNIKLQKAGGLRPALEAMDAAKRHDLDVLLGCFIETWAGISLAAQAAGRARWLDLDGAWLLAAEPVRPLSPILDSGQIEPLREPGLGVERERIHRHSSAEEE